MNKKVFYSILASSVGAASLGFIVGDHLSSNEKSKINYFLERLCVYADSAETNIVLPSIQSLPLDQFEIKQPQKINDEFWKKPSRASEIMRFGYPGFDNLRTYEV
jgi:hypothetical protein